MKVEERKTFPRNCFQATFLALVSESSDWLFLNLTDKATTLQASLNRDFQKYRDFPPIKFLRIEMVIMFPQTLNMGRITVY